MGHRQIMALWVGGVPFFGGKGQKSHYFEAAMDLPEFGAKLTRRTSDLRNPFEFAFDEFVAEQSDDAATH